MIAVAVFAVVYWKKRGRVAFPFFLLGGLSWFVAIVLKSLASAPTPQIIDGLRAVAPAYISEPILWLFIGLLTSVTECGISLIFVYWLRRMRSASWGEALGFGLGFGATEALLLGIYNFVLVLLILTIPDQLPPELLELTIGSEASLLAIPVPVVERAIVILLHAFSSVLIIFAVQTREWKWFWVSFAYKTAMDTLAGYFHITYGLQNLSIAGIWLVELLTLPFGLVGLWGLIVFRDRWQSMSTAIADG